MRKMLIVEDDFPTAELLKEYVAHCGIKAFIADNVRDALLIAQCEQPEIIFLDVFVRGENSLGSVSSFRALLPKARIVLSSATMGMGKKAWDYEINHWLPKPFSLGELDEIIDCSA